MPVLPDDGSRMVWPGRSRPCFSACSIIALAMRSFTDPNGFCISSLARIRTLGLGDRLETSTIGVLPIRSSTLSATRSRRGGPGGRALERSGTVIVTCNLLASGGQSRLTGQILSI